MDLIERQAAIDDFTKWKYQLADCFGEDYSGVSVVESAIKSLEGYPSAQPEIIRCKECKYGVQDEDERWYCRGFGCQVGDEDGSGFCADAERRTDE